MSSCRTRLAQLLKFDCDPFVVFAQTEIVGPFADVKIQATSRTREHSTRERSTSVHVSTSEVRDQQMEYQQNQVKYLVICNEPPAPVHDPALLKPRIADRLGDGGKSCCLCCNCLNLELLTHIVPQGDPAAVEQAAAHIQERMAASES